MTEILKICDSAVIAAARGCLGTPFHHQGRLKQVGVDCLGLLICVAKDLALTNSNKTALAEYDALDYGHYPDEKRLYQGLMSQLIKISSPKPAAIGLFKIDGSARHLALFGEKDGALTLIHAYAPARKVVEHRFDESWQTRLVAVFSLPASCGASKSPHPPHNGGS